MLIIASYQLLEYVYIKFLSTFLKNLCKRYASRHFYSLTAKKVSNSVKNVFSGITRAYNVLKR
jgi:hypothetical protein